MFQLSREQKICNIGGIEVGGQPGQMPCVVVSSIFQKGDRIFEGKRRREGFNEKRATQLLEAQDRISRETGVPGMADIVANSGKEFERYIDFVIAVSEMPFCIDAWTIDARLKGARYCAEKGLLDRMFYNSLTLWEKDLAREIREIAGMGIRHVLLAAFDPDDRMPGGRITATRKLLDAIQREGAQFESILIDTSVMNAPATAFCSIANRMIKEEWGFPCASAPSNGSYMWKEAREMWGFKGWSGADAALEGLAAFSYHDMIFSGPMAGAGRVFPAVAMAGAYLAMAVFAETGRLPEKENHPIHRLFPDFVAQIKERTAF